MTFHGERRWTDDVHPHESPLVDDRADDGAGRRLGALGCVLGPTGALVALAGAGRRRARRGEPGDRRSRCSLTADAGAGRRRRRAGPARCTSGAAVPVVAPAGSVLTRAARRDLYQDAINESLLMRPGQYLTRSLVFFDNRGVDGAVNGLAALVGGTSGRFRRLQTGFVRSYALSMLGGRRPAGRRNVAGEALT